MQVEQANGVAEIMDKTMSSQTQVQISLCEKVLSEQNGRMLREPTMGHGRYLVYRQNCNHKNVTEDPGKKNHQSFSYVSLIHIKGNNTSFSLQIK